MPSFMGRSEEVLTTTTTSSSTTSSPRRDLTATTHSPCTRSAATAMTTTTSSPRDLTTPTTSSPRRWHRFDDSYHLTERTSTRRTDLTTPTTSQMRAHGIPTTRRSGGAPASIYKSMDYNRELERRRSLQELVQRLPRRLEKMVYNDLTSLTYLVDLDLRSRRFGSDLSTS
jgi:hypothetical protein